MSANPTAVGAAGAVSAAVGAGSAAVGVSTAAVTSTSTTAAADSSAAGGSGSHVLFFLLVLATQPPWASDVLRDDGGYSFEVLEITIRMDILALLGGAPEYCCCF